MPLPDEAPRLAAVIPARGGSKRLPGKNARTFFDHPLIAYSIAAAQTSGLFSRIVVSTDDASIGRIAEWYGAEYLKRPPELATDAAGLIEVALHFLDALAQDGFAPEAFCQLMPNCPLRRAEDIRAHHERFAERSFQISTVRYRGVYPHWALRREANGEGRWLFGEYLVPSQELGVPVCPTGAIWWARSDAFRQQRAFYGQPFFIEEMDATRGLDIDHAGELELAELLVRGLKDRDGEFPLEPVARPPFPQATSAKPA